MLLSSISVTLSTMDPLSAASGIAGLIAVSVKAIQMVGEYVTLVHEHKKHAETLHKELLLMKQVLDQLKNLIDEEKRNGRLISADDEDRNTVLGKAFSDCTKTIEKIQDKLREPVNKFQKAMAKLKWPFDQKDVLLMVDSLRRYTQLFQLSLTVANCELLTKTFDAACEGLELQRANCKEMEKRWAGVPQIVKAAGDTLVQTETLLNLVPTFLQEVSSNIKEIGLAQRAVEQREQGEHFGVHSYYARRGLNQVYTSTCPGLVIEAKLGAFAASFVFVALDGLEKRIVNLVAFLGARSQQYSAAVFASQG